MKKLMVLLSAQFKITMVYRINMVVLLLSSFFPLVGIVFFVKNGTPDTTYDFSTPQLLTYYLFAYILNILFIPDVAWEISDDIHSGTMNYYLLLPMNYFMMKIVAVLQKNLTAYPTILLVILLGISFVVPEWIVAPSSVQNLLLCLIFIFVW